MGHRASGLPDNIEEFVACWWDTDVREDGSSTEACASLRQRGIYDALRRFLLDVIQHSAVSVEEWGKLCNVVILSVCDLREDAADFWEWLFDGEPLPERAQTPLVLSALEAHRHHTEGVCCPECGGIVAVEDLPEAIYVWCGKGCTEASIKPAPRPLGWDGQPAKDAP